MRTFFLGAGGVLVVSALGFAAGYGEAEAPPRPADTPVATSVQTFDTRTTPGYEIAVEPSAPRPLIPAASGVAPVARGFAPPVSTSAAVLLLDDASGEVLFERNGHASLHPASLTKVATAIIAIEQGDLDAVVETDIDSRTMRGSSVMGLQPGDRFPLRDLLYGLMLPSGNDAAIAIARHIAGSDRAFIEELNGLLRRLGLEESAFSNPHGLAGIGHYASAHDVALLSRYAMTLPAYREIAAADMWTARGSREMTMYSLVTEARWYIPGVDIAKSGYTESAGRTLVVSAERDGRRLHAVVMNDPFTEAVAGSLIDWGFSNFDWAQPVPSADSAAIDPPSPTPWPAGPPVDTGAIEVEALQLDE